MGKGKIGAGTREQGFTQHGLPLGLRSKPSTAAINGRPGHPQPWQAPGLQQEGGQHLNVELTGAQSPTGPMTFTRGPRAQGEVRRV